MSSYKNDIAETSLSPAPIGGKRRFRKRCKKGNCFVRYSKKFFNNFTKGVKKFTKNTYLATKSALKTHTSKNIGQLSVDTAKNSTKRLYKMTTSKRRR